MNRPMAECEASTQFGKQSGERSSDMRRKTCRNGFFFVVVICLGLMVSSTAGTNQLGVAWPNPQFTVQSTNTIGQPDDRINCVLDNLTGLMWARNANLARNTSLSVNGTCTWATAFNVITKAKERKDEIN